ncbi:TetR/AcrR family transcriptional regulator [Bradyrhizobium sp. WYCCWR 13023]|uniref:TetR/AcrR family transcriptional regulator n=1 Tax=Bradyrhizobium zhengyangense TaxID=2911009 RepID=A0A9X1REK0_9BRAD|nr:MULTISPECIES: TetR/AcrR family transcriptional regulator [Bradyrhizobium]MCG2628705.1 TetR/AcrR family transcriptional regulator [Bradyrhizobium zhengyangense]MDA9524255.1 transcriptional regulator [Bradyrhizobium sp. CCBAU 11434]
MAGRPREFDREAALEAAMLLFWRKGYGATSMNDLCEAMGVRSPSLYAAFESKEALYLAAIEHYVETQAPPVWGRLAEGAPAREGIENFLFAAAAILPKSRSAPAGCMAVLGAVSDEWPAPIARAIRKIRLEMLGNLRARIEAAMTGGELPAATDADALSRFYLSVYEGMAIQAKDGATTDELKGAARAAMAAWPDRP